MKKEMLKEAAFVEEIVSIIRSGLSKEQLTEKLGDFHENDIAQSFSYLTRDERAALYNTLGAEWMSDII